MSFGYYSTLQYCQVFRYQGLLGYYQAYFQEYQANKKDTKIDKKEDLKKLLTVLFFVIKHGSTV